MNLCQVGLKPSILSFAAHNFSLLKRSSGDRTTISMTFWCKGDKDSQQLFCEEGGCMPTAEVIDIAL